MKLLILIGPDTLAVNYKDKSCAQRAINKKLKSKTFKGNQSEAHIGYAFKGKEYCAAELKEAVVLTTKEFFNSCRSQ